MSLGLRIRMKPAVLFDLGNTLAAYYHASQFEPILEHSVREVLAGVEARRLSTVSFQTAMARAIAENREATDYRVMPLGDRLERILGLPLADDPALTMELCALFLRPIFGVARLYDDALPVLETLRRIGCPTAIVSNTPWGSPPGLWRDELMRLGLASSVDAVVFCGDVGWRKPAQVIFRHAAEAVGRMPRDCLFVGDDLKWDVEGSRASGMRPILIDRDARHTDHRGESIRTLSAILETLEQH